MAANLVERNQNIVSGYVTKAEKLVDLWNEIKAEDDKYIELDFGNVLVQSDLSGDLDHLLVADVVNFITAIRAVNVTMEAQDSNLYPMVR